MSAPPIQSVELCLSEPELKALEQFATAHNMTIDQAATHAAQQQLQARFVTARRFTNNVSRFTK